MTHPTTQNHSPTLSAAEHMTADGYTLLHLKNDRLRVETKLPSDPAQLRKMGRNLQLLMMEVDEKLTGQGGQL